MAFVDPTVNLAEIQEVIAESFPGSGNTCCEIGPGYAIAQHTVGDGDIRPGGFISGPTQFSTADAALWYATFVALDRIETMTLTSELSIRFLRPAVGSVLYARADIDMVTRRSVVGTVRMWCDDEPTRITSTAQGTYAIPIPK